MRKKKIWGLLVGEQMKKKRVKKKMQENLEWATAHSGVESRYKKLYRDRQGWEAAQGRTGARWEVQWGGHDTTRPRPRQGVVGP